MLSPVHAGLCDLVSVLICTLGGDEMLTAPNLWPKRRFMEWFGIKDSTYKKWKAQCKLSPYADAFTGMGQKEPMVDMELFQRFVVWQNELEGGSKK